MEAKRTQNQQERPGLVAGLLGVAKNLLALMINRMELASLELSQIGGKLVKFLLFFTLAAISLWFAVAFWTALVVYLAWDVWGWKILAVLGVLFTIVTATLAWYARAALKQSDLSLPMTMAELRKDRDALL